MNAPAKKSLLHVAFPSKAAMQQAPQKDATVHATTTQQASTKPASLLDLARNKLRNNHATSSQKDAQQAHSKQQVVVAHENEQIDELQETRRLKVIALLNSSPETQRAVIADSESDPHYTILTIALRNISTFEMIVEKSRFDPFQLLELIDTHSMNTH